MIESNNPAIEIERVVEKHADMVLRVAYFQLKRMPDAEDITQEVFIKLIENNMAFQSDEHLKAWLIRVTLNLCKDHWKSAWIKRVVSIRDDFAVSYRDPSGVLDAVLRLSANNRQVILLHYFYGYSIAEIAAIVGETPSAIATRLHRARKRLKLDLSEDLREGGLPV